MRNITTELKTVGVSAEPRIEPGTICASVLVKYFVRVDGVVVIGA
jgi:hypothetical protein